MRQLHKTHVLSVVFATRDYNRDNGIILQKKSTLLKQKMLDKNNMFGDIINS